ncbi:MAG: methyl-accepting chemotaxis protein [Lachnospiraceae bacterium]|nr:methyl-accepting chemotaxis protein [Lachnospiraceae bacterium]
MKERSKKSGTGTASTPAKTTKVPKAPKSSRQSRQKQAGIHSLKYSVVLLVLIAIVVSVISLMLIIVPTASNALTTMTESYLRDVCDTSGRTIDDSLIRNGNIILNYDYLGNIVGDVRINNLESSYAYVVDAEGTMVYHPTRSKAGEPVENEVIKDVIARLANGEEVENELVTYDYHGATKYAAYYVAANKAAVLVVTADQRDILGARNEIYSRSAIAAVIILIVLCLGAFILASRMFHPLLDITKVINRFSSLDFSESHTTARLSKRSDETGQMARATAELRDKLVTIVSQIKNQSQLLYNASTELDNNAIYTTSTVGTVENAVQEIATGATNQASETQRATDDILDMGNMIQHTNTQVESLSKTANLMRQSSEEAASTLRELDSINRQAISSIDIIYEQTNTTNASALKIKEATNLISSIAEETNLLSLNASIEAARAGEAGRGFAVVASQIQKLADQSNESAMQIDNIIHALLEDSQKAVHTMDEVKEIMNRQSMNVQKTGLVFQQVRDGIGHSISGVGEIANKTTQLDQARSGVVDVVQNLTAIAQQNAASTEETSASVIEVSNVIQEITENANRLKEIASILENNVNEFKL